MEFVTSTAVALVVCFIVSYQGQQTALLKGMLSVKWKAAAGMYIGRLVFEKSYCVTKW